MRRQNLMKSRVVNSQSGMALFIALMLTLMLSIIGIAIIKTSNDEISIAGNELQELIAFTSAEAGLEKASAEIQTYYEAHSMAPTSMPVGVEGLAGGTIAYATTDNGTATMSKLTMGPLTGLNALIKTYTISSVGTSTIDSSQVMLTQEFQAALVPIFQFAVFYDNDLWATPAEAMTVSGRVHVNGNMYLQCSDELNFDGRVTSSGEIHHGFPGWSGVGTPSGDVRFADKDGNLQDMYAGGDWLDADDPHWYDTASARWGGNVRDGAFGVDDLNLPLTGSTDPHKIIERYNGGANPDSYENRADLKIMNGIPYAFNGASWVDISASLPANTIQNTSFYDDREDKWVNSTDIDMGLLKTSAYFPANGVIYSSDESGSTYNGLRLVNGSDIGQPLSIFSENPLYVQGDFNTVNKQPAAVAADAVSYLSNDWDDANSDKSLRTDRTVSTATTVNVSMISGDAEPTSTSYGGGLANLPRFLEHWDKTKFTFNGSMVNLWRAQQASGLWCYGGYNEYYTAPTRDYRFDTDLEDPSKLPPETPQVQSFVRLGWKQEYVSTSDH